MQNFHLLVTMSEFPDLPNKKKLVARMRPGRSGFKTFLKQVKRAIEGDSDVDEPSPKRSKVINSMVERKTNGDNQ